MERIYIILILIFTFITFFLTVISFYFENSSHFKVNENKLLIEIYKQFNYSDCNLNFNGNVFLNEFGYLDKNNLLYNTELCLSNEQVRIFGLTSNLRPRLNTNYSGYSGPWIEDGIFCHWILQYNGNLKYCDSSELIPPVYIPIFWTSIQRNKVDPELRKDWIKDIQNILNNLNPKITYFTVLQVSYNN